jgi:hypothetical protein
VLIVADQSKTRCHRALHATGKTPVIPSNSNRKVHGTYELKVRHDELILKAGARRDGFASIGFDECRSRMLAGCPWPNG